ncbi:hypothetical protein GA0111570_103140 [Raineyella antarctica]|uniref:Hydroxylaminobenzene mutase n=1 Tax=Raineyella antarctica TaxID=1577474 RepID=A0A1G6GG09_9ACTN|nr:DUF6394 family protein [Raineyella antarctica]SDB80829.1 hypothetical protein GA0111570_103140 [Raineyella antarctica]
MNFEKIVFGFFITLAATLNFGFTIGNLGDPLLHNVWELAAAILVSLIATVLKFGDRTQLGAVHLATSLVADLQLIGSGIVWTLYSHVAGSDPLSTHQMATVVSLSAGALFANTISVVLMITESVMLRR